MAENIESIEPEMTQEQVKRADLLAEYEKEIDGPRSERNAAIELHDTEWGERWAKLQGEIDQTKSDKTEELIKSGTPVAHHKSVLDLEAAKLVEAHEVTRDGAAAALDAEMPRPKRWLDFLQEKALGDGDPVISELIEEAKSAPEPSYGGASDGQARPVLSDLTHKVDKSGVHYHRNGKEVLHDTGPRLNVKRLDDRDIEAALRIAGQKFDMDKGLILTGDAPFKMRSAEIAGRLGLPIQGNDPAIQQAWAKGRDSVNPLKQIQPPFVERSIAGAARSDIDLSPVLIKVDPRLVDYTAIDHPAGLGVVVDDSSRPGNLLAHMPAERYLAAMSAWRDTSRETLDRLAGADLTHPESLDLTGLENRPDVQPLIEAGSNHLSQLGRDLVLVRDAHAIEARARMDGLDADLHANLYLTSLDRVVAAQERPQVEKALISRNVDEAAQTVEKAKEEVKEAEEVKAEHKEVEKAPAHDFSDFDALDMGR